MCKLVNVQMIAAFLYLLIPTPTIIPINPYYLPAPPLFTALKVMIISKTKKRLQNATSL